MKKIVARFARCGKVYNYEMYKLQDTENQKNAGPQGGAGVRSFGLAGYAHDGSSFAVVQMAGVRPTNSVDGSI